MVVEILTKQNRIARGVVDVILTKEPYQMYGIIVVLKSGESGRVQKIILDVDDINKKNAIELKKIIEKGENFNSEFKLSSLWSVNYAEEDIKKSRSMEVHYYKQKASKIIIAKSISAFMNSEGGNLIIGVKEKKEGSSEFEIIGINDEFKKLKDQTKDGYKRMILDEIIKPYFPGKIINHLNKYLDINFIDMEDKVLCLINIKRSESRVFLRIVDREIFMIRTESENRILEGEKLVDYCIRHWKVG
jgi:predicted HTH transcriptional regulator/uncharacterized protein YwbE